MIRCNSPQETEHGAVGVPSWMTTSRTMTVPPFSSLLSTEKTAHGKLHSLPCDDEDGEAPVAPACVGAAVGISDAV